MKFSVDIFMLKFEKELHGHDIMTLILGKHIYIQLYMMFKTILCKNLQNMNT